MKNKIPTMERILEGGEPSQEEILEFMKINSGESFYSAREKLREIAYGGKPPNGFDSWGTYWKCF